MKVMSNMKKGSCSLGSECTFDGPRIRRVEVYGNKEYCKGHYQPKQPERFGLAMSYDPMGAGAGWNYSWEGVPEAISHLVSEHGVKEVGTTGGDKDSIFGYIYSLPENQLAEIQTMLLEATGVTG